MTPLIKFYQLSFNWPIFKGHQTEPSIFKFNHSIWKSVEAFNALLALQLCKHHLPEAQYLSAISDQSMKQTIY